MQPNANQQNTTGQVNPPTVSGPPAPEPTSTSETSSQPQSIPGAQPVVSTTGSSGPVKKPRKKLIIAVLGVFLLIVVGFAGLKLLNRDAWSAKTKQSFLAECKTTYARSGDNVDSQCKCMLDDLMGVYTEAQLDEMHFSLGNLDSAAFSEVTKAATNCQKS